MLEVILGLWIGNFQAQNSLLIFLARDPVRITFGGFTMGIGWLGAGSDLGKIQWLDLEAHDGCLVDEAHGICNKQLRK